MMSAVAYGIVCGDAHRALYAKAREGHRMRLYAQQCALQILRKKRTAPKEAMQ